MAIVIVIAVIFAVGGVAGKMWHRGRGRNDENTAAESDSQHAGVMGTHEFAGRASSAATIVNPTYDDRIASGPANYRPLSPGVALYEHTLLHANNVQQYDAMYADLPGDNEYPELEI